MTFIQPYIVYSKKKIYKCLIDIGSSNISQTPKTAHKRKSASLWFLIFLKFDMHQIVIKIYIEHRKICIHHHKNWHLQIQSFDSRNNSKSETKTQKT